MTDIGGKRYVENLNGETPQLKNPCLRKEQQEKGDYIKVKMRKVNYRWNDWKLHIHWYRLEWLDTNNHNAKKNTFFVSSHKFFLKDYKNECCWVVHSKTNPIDAD